MKKYTKALEKEIERIKKTGMVSESFITGFEAATNRIRNMEELSTPSPEVIEELKEIRRKFTYDTLPDGSTSNITGTWSYDNEDMGRAINAIIRYLHAYNAGRGK